MLDDVAPCPRCKRTLRLVKAPPAAFVKTSCPACGAPIVVASASGLDVIDEAHVATWRFRRLMHDQGIDVVASGGSGIAFGSLIAFAAIPGHGIAIAGAVVAGLVAGAMCAGSVAADARGGAAAWRAELLAAPDLFALQPEGYRA